MDIVRISHTHPLRARIDQLTELAREPGSERYLAADQVDFEAWNHVGDPLCEDLLRYMREHALMGGDIYENARGLEADGLPAATAFFRDVEAVPVWADFEAMRAGAAMGRRNPIGLMFGMHGGLTLTYTDPATAEVMDASGRLGRGGDYSRRFWETATGFIGALDVDGMKPGGRQWVKWVRIRFMHTMIRMGILRANRWALNSMPVSQLASAAGVHIFGPYRTEIIRYFGGIASQQEEDSFALMWRWVARLQGVNNQLLGRTMEEQWALQQRAGSFLYGPTQHSRDLTQALIDGASKMKIFLMPRRMHSAVVHNLLSPKRIKILGARDIRDDFGLGSDKPAELAVGAVSLALKLLNQWQRIPVVRRPAERYGQELVDSFVNKGLQGVKANYRAAPVGGQATDR